VAKRDGKSRPITPSRILAGALGLGLLGSVLGSRHARAKSTANLANELRQTVVPIKSIRRAAQSRPSKSTLAERMSEHNEEILSATGRQPKRKVVPQKSMGKVIDFEAAKKKRLEKRGSFWDGFYNAMEDAFYE
jgi:hypothetical protein